MMDARYEPISLANEEDVNFPEAKNLFLDHELQSLRKTKVFAQIFALLAFIAFFVNLYVLMQWCKREANLEDGLYPNLVPRSESIPKPMARISKTDRVQVPVETIIFQKNNLYSSPLSDESNQAWAGLIPSGAGFVFAEQSKGSVREPGETTEYGEMYAVSLFHQLHCLSMLRSKYWMIIEMALNKTANLEGFARHHKEDEHVSHCFDYLRQAIQCSGDMTLEWPRTEPDGRRDLVDGWDIPHLCKSWDSIMDYMDHNHSNISELAEGTKISRK